MSEARWNEDGSRVIPIEDSDNRRGDIAEYYVVTWLWDQGYEVYKNAGCSGPIDLIATKGSDITFIDVKNSSITRTPEQKKMGVVIVAFDSKTRKARWVNHRDDHE